MQKFRFHSKVIAADDPLLPVELAAAHGDKKRPLCLCTADGVTMYVAHVGERYIIKRMPNSGSHHHPDCESYEPPAELSGLGEVSGSAIQEDVESGLTTLKLDFSLSKSGRRIEPVVSPREPESVRTDGSKLTLRGTLHYLWDQAELNRWTPGMAGKRTWYVVRGRLKQAAANKLAKGDALGAMLYIPEPFSVEHKDEILARRLAKLGRISAPASGSRKLMLMIAEVKLIEPSRYGHKLIVKHLPDMPLMMAEDLYKRMAKRFANDLALWDADESTHLVMIGTFGFDGAGNACVEELSLIVTTANWLPVEHRSDLQLMDALTHSGRRFTKGLRYNLAGDRPLASAVLSDTAPKAVALYIVPANATSEHRQALDELIAGSELNSWVWRAGKAAMPALPARAIGPAIQPPIPWDREIDDERVRTA
jgi:hypothetical protein